jgi:hypothetical protein
LITKEKEIETLQKFKIKYEKIKIKHQRIPIHRRRQSTSSDSVSELYQSSDDIPLHLQRYIRRNRGSRLAEISPDDTDVMNEVEMNSREFELYDY